MSGELIESIEDRFKEYNKEKNYKGQVDQLKATINNNFKKMLKCRHNIELMEFHNTKNEAPSCLDFDKFPCPFLDSDVEFVDKYNELIKSFQTSTIKFIIDFLHDKE